METRFNQKTARSSRRPASQTILGGIIILLGGLLLLETTGIADTTFLLDYVPTLFVLVGVYALVSSNFHNVGGPLIVITVSGAWQLVALDVVVVNDVVQFWPILLIVFGLSVVLGRMRSRVETVEGEYVSTLAIFGGRNQRVTARPFVGGDLTVLFGGAELDLRDATLDEPPVHVTANALFGGVEVIVPRDWNVEVDVLPVFGGASDDRPRREGQHGEIDLVVTGFAAFGAVEVSD
ncbi:LiaF transmembrane domain-containing protein [Haladaptatus sp. NG-SE-30]